MGHYRVPPEWEQYGARFERDGLLYLAEWRRGFTVHELRALFFECQQVRTLARENARLTRELDTASRQADTAEARAAWYRRQLILESRFGAMLRRLTDAEAP
jgi:hypothetical protein